MRKAVIVLGVAGAILGLGGVVLTFTVGSRVLQPIGWVGPLCSLLAIYGAVRANSDLRQSAIIMIVAAIGTAVSVVSMLAAPFLIIGALLAFMESRR